MKLKDYIKNIYSSFVINKWIYYFREDEFRLNICHKNDEEKIEIFCKILKENHDLHNYDFYDEDELLDNDNYDYIIN